MRVCLFILGFFCCISLGFCLFLETDYGQARVQTALINVVHKRFHAHLSVKKIRCFFPFFLQLENASCTTLHDEPLLSFSEATIAPFPLPLSPNELLIPYLSIKSLHMHIGDTLGKTPSFFVSIPFLRLHNTESHDPSLQAPYAFSFFGGLKVENDLVYIHGHLHDQTTLPLHKAEGELIYTQGALSGKVSCSFKKNSLMEPFQKVLVSFEPIPGEKKSITGSWELDSSKSMSNGPFTSFNSQLKGTFGIHWIDHSWSVCCKSFTMASSFDLKTLFPWLKTPTNVALLSGEWLIEGAFPQNNQLDMNIKRCLLNVGQGHIQFEGFAHCDAQHTELSCQGDLSTFRSHSSFTFHGEEAHTEEEFQSSISFSSPFAILDGEWKSTRNNEKGSLSTHISNLPHLMANELFHSMSLKASYSSEETESCQITCQIEDLSSENVSAHSLHAQASFSSSESIRGHGDFVIEHGAMNDTMIHVGKAHVEFLDGHGFVSLFSKGRKHVTPWEFEASLSTEALTHSYAIECSHCQGKVSSLPFLISSPITCSFSPKIGLHDLHAEFAIGERGRLALHEKNQEFCLTYDHCPLDPFLLFVPHGHLRGEISGETSWNLSEFDPKLETHTTCTSSVLVDLPDQTPHTVELNINGNTRRNLFDMNLHLHDHTASQDLHLQATLPLRHEPSLFSSPFDPLAPMKVDIQGCVDFGCITAFLYPDPLSTSGQIQGHIQIQGTARAPLIEGTCDIEEGMCAIPSLDALIVHISAHTTFHGSKADIHFVHGKAGSDGSIDGQGSIDLSQGSLRWVLNLKLDAATFVHLQAIQAEATGLLHLVGMNGTLSIQGDARIDSCHVDLSKFDSSYPPIPLKPKHTQTRFIPSPISLKLHLTADHSVKLIGRAFDTTWSAKTTIDGPVNKLSIQGEATCDEGTLFFAGRRMTLEQGSLQVQGSFFKDSHLEVIMKEHLKQVTAKVAIIGSLNKIHIFLRSTPVRSEKEILSLLLFDKEITNISPLESLQLANTALSLEKKMAGATLFDMLKGTLGIDSLTIGSTEAVDNNVSLRVGKNISKGVTVTLSKDISTAANRVGLEMDLTEEIKAQAMVGDDESAVLFLTWKKEF